MSSPDAASRAAVPVSNARAEAGRRNGAKSRGPKTAEGKARSAMNALKHGLRAEKYVTLVEEEWEEFAKLEAALTAELAPEGPLQSVLARRIARAAWRLMRADRLEVEVFAERHFRGGGPGLALIRDTNGSRTFDTLLRYRGAAMAEFMRALRTLQAEQAALVGASTRHPEIAPRPAPNEPERCAERRLECVLPEPPARGRSLREPAAPAPRGLEPDEPDSRSNLRESGAARDSANPSSGPGGRAPAPVSLSLPRPDGAALQRSAPDRRR